MSDQKTTESRVVAVIAETLSVDTAEVNPSATFDSLGVDSIDKIEIVMAIEDEFDICITDEESEEVNTVQQAIELVNAH